MKGLPSCTHCILVSADAAHSLMLDLLPANLSTSQYEDRDFALIKGVEARFDEMAVPTSSSSHKALNRPRIDALFDTILTSCSESRARLLAAGSVESGARLNAPPVSSFNLRMSDKAIRIAVGLRAGAPL